MIVVVTFVVGLFVFVQGLHRPAEQLTTANTVAGDEPAVSPTSSLAPPPATHAPAELAIVVGNAVDKKRPVASEVAEKLDAAGYPVAAKLNVSKLAARSSVYFAAPEFRDDAVAVARAVGLDEADVAPLPNPAPLDSPDSKVYLIVGKEPAALVGGGAPTTRRGSG